MRDILPRTFVMQHVLCSVTVSCRKGRSGNVFFSHLNFVEGMDSRCLRELGYVPYRLGKRLNERMMEFFPLQESLIIQPTEPIDP